jgi:hypothetical protein
VTVVAAAAASRLPKPLTGGAGATPGVLMFIGGLALVYWALSGWGLFGLGDRPATRRFFGPMAGRIPKLTVLPGGQDEPPSGGGSDARLM